MSDAQGLRVGFIGSGWPHRVQIAAFRAGGLMPYAIASAREENARHVAASHGLARAFTEWQELVADEAVDLVSICTPPHLHRVIAEAALAAGKHVLCEKPTALNGMEAEAMLAAAQAAPGRLAIIDHELRFHPQRLQMRHLIQEGYVGSVVQARFDRLGSERLKPDVAWNWWSDAARGGGMLGALGSHLIDLARWIIGRIESLTAQLQIGPLYRAERESGQVHLVTADDHADLLLRFVNGAMGAITVSGITPGGYGMSILVVGTDGALRLDNQDQLFGMQGNYPGGAWEPIRSMSPSAPLAELLRPGPFAVGSYYLAQALATSLPMGKTLLEDAASFYDGLVVQRAMDAARRAHADRTWESL